MSDKVIAYLIDITIQSNGYEHQTSTLIIDTDENSATTKALLAESHNQVGEGAEFISADQLEDCYGEFIYTVNAVKEVTESEFEVLRKFMYFY